MTTREVYLVDAFTSEPLSGNAAGVLTDANGLSAGQMQAVARELSVSETAFLFESEDADRKIRFFTPTKEVDLCGHATIAAHALLYEEGRLEPGTHSLETNAGILDIDVREDGAIWMTQSTPQIETVDVDYSTLASALGVDEATLLDVGADLPIARATTGLPFLVVPINFLQSLGSAMPDSASIEQLSAEYDVAGVYVFTFDALAADSTLHARMFAPTAGVDEDPVTGTASGACGAYLDAFDAFDALPEEMRFEQGHFIDRGGLVRVRADVDDRGRKRVRVGGRAVTTLDGSIVVPDRGDDEIIET